jgi:hypothetical protein
MSIRVPRAFLRASDSRAIAYADIRCQNPLEFNISDALASKAATVYV